MKKVTNKNLQDAKRKKNDEFYTRYEDIEKEITNYKEYLKGKWIYSPCDDFRWSEFKTYFKNNFEELGLKHYTCTCLNIGNGAWRYDFDGKTETLTQLEGNGDFRSEECTKIMKECDVVITNPPFSLFKEFITWLNVDFIVVGNKNAMLWKTIFPKYYYKQLYFGYNYISKFRLPDNTFNWFQGSGKWFTTFPVIKENPPIALKPYAEDKYPKYDTYDAVNTDSIRDIPDYDGEIGTPIGILDYLCEDQFTITGMLCRGSGDIDKAKPIINGQHLYSRVLIKKNHKQ